MIKICLEIITVRNKFYINRKDANIDHNNDHFELLYG